MVEIKIMRSYSNLKLHPKGQSSKFFVDFPDSLDSGVLHKQALQWSYRAMIEAKDCFNKGGFVLFDTLTYDDIELKWFHDIEDRCKYICWDYPCFCRQDIQLFLKRLRKKLHYLAFDVEGNFRYLITSEYGSSSSGTHRPHYHCLFYVTFDIEPTFLSSLISSCWCSITDGYPDQKREYVEEKRVFRGVCDYSLNVFNYVAKYITKDLYTFKKLSRRAYIAFTLLYPDWQKSARLRGEFRRFKSQVLNFHLQSLHFGESALHDVESLKRGFFIYHLNGEVYKVSIDGYFERKYYQHLETRFGSLCWCRNNDEMTFEYYWKKSQRSCRQLAYNLQNYYNLSFEKCMKISSYHYYKRGILMPIDYIRKSDKFIFTNTYFKKKPKEMANYFHKRVSFADKVFLGLGVGIVTNYLLRDLFKYKYVFDKDNNIVSRSLIDPRIPVGLSGSRHSVRLPVHSRKNLLNVSKICPLVNMTQPIFKSCDEFVNSKTDGHIVYRNVVYDKFLDNYFDKVRESRSLDNLRQYQNSRTRYIYKTMQGATI